MENLFNYIGGNAGAWRVTTMVTHSGQPLPVVTSVQIVNGAVEQMPTGSLWNLRGIVSNSRYVTFDEAQRLKSRQPMLNRAEATCGTLIPIRKTSAWWNLAQDERRDILETRSRHIETGMQYLPAIARRLQHSRDLGEPFDFVTWFEYSPQDTLAFEALSRELRATEEWKYVDREIEFRLVRDADI